MGAHLGADADGLVALAGRFASAATALDRLIDEIGVAVRSAWWRGRDADEFAAAWTGQAGVVGRASTVLRSTGEELHRQADDQRRASGDDPVAAADGLVEGADGLVTGPAGRALAELVGPRPRAVRWVRAGVELQAVEADVARSLVYRIDDLPGGRSIVSELSRTDGGLQAGPDRRVQVWWDDHHLGAGVGAMAALDASLSTTKAWEMPSGKVDDFVRGQILDHVTETAVIPLSSSLGFFVPFAGVAVSMVSDALDGSVTTGGHGPTWEGIGAGVWARANAGTAGRSSPAQASAAFEGRADVAVSRRASDGAIAVDVTGAVAGSVHARLAGAYGDREVAGEATERLRLVFERHGSPAYLESTSTVAHDGRVVEQHATVDLATPEARAIERELARAGRQLVDTAEARRLDRIVSDAGRAADALGDAVARLAPTAQIRTDVFTVADVDSSGIATPAGGIDYSTARWVREP